MNLVMNPITEKRVASYIKNMPHALLVTGPHGVGASTIAAHMALQLSPTVITVLPEKDEIVDLEKGTITVGLIRRLYEQTRTKTDRLVVVIDYAERMAPQAQNAFLKLLEEPTSGVSFILVSHEAQKLLPTIRSRVQSLELLPISQTQSQEFIDSLKIIDVTKRSQLLYIAGGLPAELKRLAEDEEYFEKCSQIVRDARDLLQSNTYQKLKLAHTYKDNRPDCLRMIEIAMKMLRSSLNTAGVSINTTQLEQLLETYDSINGNGNIRLQLARFAL